MGWDFLIVPLTYNALFYGILFPITFSFIILCTSYCTVNLYWHYDGMKRRFHGIPGSIIHITLLMHILFYSVQDDRSLLEDVQLNLTKKGDKRGKAVAKMKNVYSVACI